MMTPSEKEVAKAAAVLSSLGASKGGKARARALTKKRRSEIARMGARAMHAKRRKTRRKGKAA